MNRVRIKSAREASWTAATESSESPLCLGVAVSAASIGVLSAATAKAVTAQTPSPQSKTWRQIRRFMGSLHGLLPAHWAESADQSDAFQTLRDLDRAIRGRASVWSARGFSAAFPKLPRIFGRDWFMETSRATFGAHWNHEPSPLRYKDRKGESLNVLNPLGSALGPRVSGAQKVRRGFSPLVLIGALHAIVGWAAAAPATSDRSATESNAGPRFTSASNSLFAARRLVEIKIEIAPQDWDVLRQQHHDLFAYLGPQRLTNPPPDPYTFHKADLSIDGVKVKSVGLRKKGFLGSADAHRPSLNLYFDQYLPKQQFAGLRKLSLNNNKQDPSQMHQALAYQVFATAGVPAPRCNLARVTVNGNDLGVYSLVEPIDDLFLRRQFKEAGGNLYEGTITDFRPEWVKTFEKKINKQNHDRSDLEGVVTALQSDDASLLRQLEPLIHLDAYLTFWAVEGLIGHWDSYSNNQNNFFVYRNPANRKFSFLPWGADSCFGDADPFTSYKAPESVKAVSLLPRRLYDLPATRERYRDGLRHVLKNVWDEKTLLAEVDRMEAMLKEHAHVSQDQFAAGVAQVRKFIQGRRAAVQRELDRPAPEWTFPLKKSPFLQKTGQLTSTFATTWQDAPPQNPFANGTATLTLELDGEAQKLSAVGISAGQNQRSRGVGSPTISLIGLGGADGKLLVPLLIFEPEFYSPNAALKVDGYSVLGLLFEGVFGQGEPKIAGVLRGTLNLKEAATRPGGAVSGALEAEVFRLLR